MSLGEMKNKWLDHLLIAFHPKALTICWISAGLLAFLFANAFPPRLVGAVALSCG
jgi:hypothetical protein